jgi:phospholipid/cholesterol/gamma-HCH transport system substrate-binding protein
MEYYKSEIKAGLVVVLAIILLTVMIFMVGNFRFKESYPVKLRFNFISGLEVNAPVRFAGAEVGKVKEIRLLPDDALANIEVTLMVDKEARVKKDTQAYINTLGLIGEKYVELSPGTKSSPLLGPDEIIIGNDPTQMDQILNKGVKIADQIDQAITDLRALITSTNNLVTVNQQDVRKIIQNLEATTAEAKEFAKEIREKPWRLIWKTKETKSKEKETKPEPGANKGVIYSR